MLELIKRLKKSLFYLVIFTFILSGGYLSLANLERSYEIDTVHIFPSIVTSNGFENVQTITHQNVDEYALFQDFNKLNSAVLVGGDSADTDTDRPDQSSVDTSEGVASSTDDNELDTNETGDADAGELPTDTETSTGVDESNDETENVAAPEAEEMPEAGNESASTEESASTPPPETTVLQPSEGVYELAIGFFSRALASTTDTAPVAEEILTEMTDVASEDATADDADGAAEQPATQTDVRATTTDASPEQSGETATATTSEPVIAPVATETPAELGEHVIRLSDFGYPLDEGASVEGAQLRLSLAAETISDAVEIPTLVVRYSSNGGQTWETAGSVVLDEEVSNSLNGGYFLFALPAFSDAAALDSLMVEIVYEDDIALLKNLYIESAWLELFTVSGDQFEEINTVPTLEDDGYREELLSGDELVLPSGETVSITETDNNRDETLIIKTDRSEYVGLSEVVTYVSVTNESGRVDDFTLQTYFPQAVGEVATVREYNQNKPRLTSIPEYRPYVFNCEAGWESSESVEAASLEEFSQQLIEVEDPAAVEFALPTTTDDVGESSNDLMDTTVSTTVGWLRVPSAQPLAQAATTASSADELAAEIEVTEVADESSVVDVEPVEPESEPAASYMCRNTNIIRTCDYIDGDNTACHIEKFLVDEHQVTTYAPGWDEVALVDGAMPKAGFFRSALQAIGFGPDRKAVPDAFEARSHSATTYRIQPGETKYFEMTIAFPPHTAGEYWIEAVGTSEYGLLDPYWTSNWNYRMPIHVNNPTGTYQTEYQVLMNLDSSNADFWDNVASDGGDIRFVQEIPGTFSDEGVAVNNWIDFDFGHRIPIEVPAGVVTSNLTNFPIAINLSNFSDDFWDNVKADGGDIRVYASTDAELPFELGDFNVGTKQGVLYFLANNINAASAQTFYIYFNDPARSGYAVTDPYGARAVWDEYDAVYHFSDNPSGSGSNITDVTGNGHTLTTSGAGLGTATGKFGVALDFTTVSNRFLTNSGWAFTAGRPLVATGLIKQAAVNGESLFQWGSGAQPNWVDYRPWYSGVNGLLYFGATAGAAYPTTLATAGGNWTSFAVYGATSTAQSNFAYENGVLMTTFAQSVANPSNTNNLQVGHGGSGGGPNWQGQIDELRFTSVARSAAWLQAESAALQNPTAFYVKREVQTPNNAPSYSWYSTSWNQRIRLSIPAHKVKADLTDFPVYVNLGSLGSAFFNDVAVDGSDIRVTAGDGVTELPIEVVAIDTDAKTGEIYFKTNLTRSDVNEFYIYTGNDDATAYDRTDIYGSDAVWSNGFRAVYHFEEDAPGTGNPGVYRDSTANQFDADDENSSNGKAGIFGAAQEFGDSQNDYIRLPHEIYHGIATTTASWWMNSTNTGAMAVISGANAAQVNEYIQYFSGGSNLNTYYQGSAESTGLNHPSSYSNGTWQHFMSVADDVTDQIYVYQNGQDDTENPDPQPIAALSIDIGGFLIGQEQDLVGGNFSAAENFEGYLDEVRLAEVVRSKEWAEVEYKNMAEFNTFVATSSLENLRATNFRELDFWVQQFDYANETARIWVQVDDLPADDPATVFLYYGAPGAASASNELATFSYSTSTPVYYAVGGGAANDLTVTSLIDNNVVRLGGGSPVTLQQGESHTFATIGANDALSVLGPVSSKLRASGADSHDMLAPISYATTSLLAPTNRNANRWYIRAPFGASTVTTYIGSSGTPNQTLSMAANSNALATADPVQTSATADGTNFRALATEPVLIYHRSTTPGDGYLLYPPTTDDLYGFKSNHAYISALTSNPDPTIYCAPSGSSVETGILFGELDYVNACTGGADLALGAMRITGQSSPMVAIQQADGAGNDATAFWPALEFGTQYALPYGTSYIAVICAPEYGELELDVIDPTGNTISSHTCTPTTNNPNSLWIDDGGGSAAVNFTAGTRVVSTNNVPFYAIFEDVTNDDDETNLAGAVQARKFGGTEATFIFGPQELANITEWEQLSFRWYENTNSITPTTGWLVGDTHVGEGAAVTGGGALVDGDVIRLRMNLEADHATATIHSNAFLLQYAAAPFGQCQLAADWRPLGEQGSTTAAFSGYDNSSVGDGTRLATTTLSASTIRGSYEERNYSDFLPVDVGVGGVIEYDWVIEATNTTVNTNYCFRMTRAEGDFFKQYTSYPQLITVGPPEQPTNISFFDNEHTVALTPVVSFVASDVGTDDINYRVQIATDPTFGTVLLDRNSATHFTQFENIQQPADKAPFTTGQPIRFTASAPLASSTTYWWRVQATDPDGSATTSPWSAPTSFTTDTTLETTEWYQTTTEQFATNGLTGLTATGGNLNGATGQVVTGGIDFDKAAVGNAWGEVVWNATVGSGDLRVQVQYYDNGTWKNIPNAILAGNDVGVTTGPINLLELDTRIYNQLRLVGYYAGTGISLHDWRVRWGLRVEVPVQNDLFDNEKTANTLPVFDFVSSDPQGDDVEYEISFSSSHDFTASTTYNSFGSSDFANVVTGGDSSPFNSGERITFTTPGGAPFADGTTYWWRTRAKDPVGGNAWSPWSEPDSFTVNTGTPVSTWFQTTKDQFEEGNLVGTVASTSNSVLVSDTVGEYGTITLTNNNWTTVTTNTDYINMVVVASPEYAAANGSGDTSGRTPRIRNKTQNSFEIKVDTYNNAYSGSTVVDYMVMEAGDWVLDGGGSGVRVIAGTKFGVNARRGTGVAVTVPSGENVPFSPAFSTAPIAIATVASDNDSNWIGTEVNGVTQTQSSVTATGMNVGFELSRSATAHAGPEDIDYIVFEKTNNATNNGVQFKVFDSSDSVGRPGHNQTFPSPAFGATPEVTLVQINGIDGGDGAFAIKELTRTQSSSVIGLSTIEIGATADTHTTEVVSVLAIRNSSGVLRRHNGGNLTGSIASEDIIFTDGTGPKFDNFSWVASTPGTSELRMRVQYKISEGVYALVPDAALPGNSTGFTSSPIDLTALDINTYPVIRTVATLTCGGGNCPSLQEWQLEWGEGFNMSGTLHEYDRLTAVASGTIRAAVNGATVATTGTVSGGIWSMTNVTAFAGDIVTVWVDGAAEEDEAVAAFVYDGVGDITGVRLFEQHLSIAADEHATTTNALLGLNDSTAVGDEDVFYEVDVAGNLVVCGNGGGCDQANIYIGPGNVYIPQAASGASVSAHDFVNYGTVQLHNNTATLSGSWLDYGSVNAGGSTVTLAATTGVESIFSSTTPLQLHSLVLGSGAGTATFTASTTLDLSGDITVTNGTFNRGTVPITLAGNLTNGATGFWIGSGTTTFDGAGNKVWTDANPDTQTIGTVVIDGASVVLTAATDVAAYDIIIGNNDTFVGGSGTIYLGGDWVNDGTFTSQSSTVQVVADERAYPPLVPGSADWYADTGFTRRIPLVVQSANVDEDLTNFPVYVDLSMFSTAFFNAVQADGDDIRVTAGNGQTELPIELVAINTVAKTGELHFRAGSLSSSTSTTFYVYYNNPAATKYAETAPYGRNAVWADYEAVYHMQESPLNLYAQITDATGNYYNLSVENATTTNTTGRLGRGISLMGVSTVLRSTSFTWPAGSRLTTSGWYKMPAASGEALWQFGEAANPNHLQFRPWYSGNNGLQYFGSSAGNAAYSFSPRDTVNWTHFYTFGATSTSDSNYVYHDNILRETNSQSVANPSNTHTTGLQIGREGTTGSLEAEIDELRFAAALFSQGRMSTEYKNQYNPSSFYQLSPSQTYLAPVIIDEATHNITAGGSAFNNIVFVDAEVSPAFTESSVVVNGDLTIATGTVTLPTSVLTVGGSFTNSGNFMHNNAEVVFTSGGTETITLNGTEFFNHFNDVTFAGGGTFTFTDATATTSGDVVIEDGLVVFPSDTLTIGGTLRVTDGGFDANDGTVVFVSAENESITTGGSPFYAVSFGSTNSSAGWFDAAWGQRIKIEVDAAHINAPLSNFPVSIDMSTLGDVFWDGVKLDGGDIRVTTANGYTEIPVDIGSITVASSTGDMYFLAPALSPVMDTVFYIYFENVDATLPDAASVNGSQAVWDGYEAVYHFSTDPLLGIADATAHGRDLVTTVGTPLRVNGVFGYAIDTTEVSSAVEDPDWTWQAGDDLVSSGLYFMDNVDSGALWQFGIGSGSNNGSYLAFMPNYDLTSRGRHVFGRTTNGDYTVTPPNFSIWHHFTTIGRAAVGANSEVYEDNILYDVNAQYLSSQNPTNTGMRIGRYQTTTYGEVRVDELRFTTTIPSDAWMTAEYRNFSNPETFYSTSTESYIESVPTFTLNEAVTTVADDMFIYYANVLAPSSNFYIGGSAFNTGGSYNPNDATTTFNSTDTGEVVEFGDGAFYNLAFNGVGGGWLIGSTTVLNDASLVTGADFTLATGSALTVNGHFNNTFASAATTWSTSSRLILTGGDYVVTDRLSAGDDYGTVVVSGDTDIVIWNSTIANAVVRDSSSLYMPDYDDVDGVLRIYGDYTRVSGTEHWSYATDFDGTSLSGNERPVAVQFGRGASFTVATGSTLSVLGAPGATTTLSALSGIYRVILQAATLNMNYASAVGMGKNGLQLRAGTAVTSLTNTSFAVGSGRSGITVDAATMNVNPSETFTAVSFSSTTANSIYDAAWTDQVVVTIPAIAVTETQIDYPLYIDLATLGADFWAGVASDGRDIRVTTDEGVELPIDLVEFSAGTQTGELHVLVPELQSNTENSFYIHFNNPAATMYPIDHEYGATSVWRNYEAVYHFNTEPLAGIMDMTGNGRNLNVGVGSPATTTGLLGTALDTTDTSSMMQSIGWMWTAGEDLISSGVYHMDSVDSGALWQFGDGYGTNNGSYLAFMPNYDGTNRGRHFFGITNEGDYSVPGYVTSEWHHFTTVGRAAVGEYNLIYEDNVLHDSVQQIGTSANPSNTNLKIGRYQTNVYSEFQLDELRFTTIVPSTHRIALEYTNLTDPTSLYSTSTVQTSRYNVTLEGVPATFWQFAGGSGSIYGENFDNDDGDPGAVQWDDSNFAVSISGTVYSDNGITPATAPLCNGVTEVVTVALDGVPSYSAACDPLDGSYTVTGIVYTGEPKITTYITGSAAAGVTQVVVHDEVTGSGDITTGTMTVNRPDVFDNSVLVVMLGKDDNLTISAPAGWTEVTAYGDTSGDDVYTGVWYKVVPTASTEPTSYTFTSADTGEEVNYWMGSLLNVDTGTPIDVAGTWSKQLDNMYVNAPAITTTQNGSLALAAWYVYGDASHTEPLGGWRTRALGVTQTANGLTVAAKSMPVAGSTGISTIHGIELGYDAQAVQVAFRAAAAPVATTSITAAAVTKTPIGSLATHEVVTLRDARQNAGMVAGAGGTFTVDRPQVANGDVLVLITAREEDETIVAPAGWLLGAQRAEINGNDMYTAIWSKVITDAGSEPASYTFTNYSVGTQEYSYWVGSFSGVNRNQVFNITPTWDNLQNVSEPTAASITTTAPNAYVLAAWYVIDDAHLTATNPAWSRLADNLQVASRNLIVSGRSFTIAGATGAISLANGTTDDVNVGQFAINPAPISVANKITDMNLHQDYVIVRHENTDPLTIADMAAFDSSDTADLPFTATIGAPNTLSVLAGTGLRVWKGRQFAPGGVVTLAGSGSTAADGSLFLGNGATYTGGSNALTIGGSFAAGTGAVYTPGTSPVTFAATHPGQSITSAASSTITFRSLNFTNGGAWAVQTPIISQQGITLASGTVSGVANVTVQNGNFAGNGTVNMTGGMVTMNTTNTLGGTAPWTFYNLRLGSGAAAGVTTPAGTATTSIRNQLTISSGHFLDALTSRWDLQGSLNPFIETGTFLEGASTVRYSGTTPNILRTAYNNLVVDTDRGGSVTAVAPVTGLQVLGTLSIGQLGTSSLNINTHDPAVAIGGNVLIGTRGTLIGSNSALMTVIGSWDNNGIYTANGGEVLFQNNLGGARTIAAGNSAFGKLTIAGDSTYTMIESATTTGDMRINALGFTLTNGRSLAVGGSFTNQMADANTTWTGTTLRLLSGTAFTINPKSVGDTYATLVMSNGTHPRLWNSTANTITTNGVSSLYSMNHAGVTGDLVIYGDLVSNTFTDHWSYVKDFDGAILGAPRAAHVRVENGGSFTYTGGTLELLGTSTATTTVSSLGGGTYAATVSGTTNTTMQYYSFRNTTAAGLSFAGTPIVHDLSSGDFEVTIPGASAMTVAGSVIDANPAQEYNHVRLATTTAISAYNVTATGISSSAWRFVNVIGNLGGEDLDVDPGGDPGYITWEDSAAVITISGHVYQAENTTPSAVCDGSTNNIRLSVNGTTFASASCSATDGFYQFTNISYGLGNTLTVYIDGESEKATTVTQDPISNITNFDLYENRVVIKHEGTQALTIADMSIWDSSDDSDVLFTAVNAGTDTLTLPANTKLLVASNKKFAPGGNVTVSGGGAGGAVDGTVELRANAQLIAANGEIHSFGGDFITQAGAVFTPAQSTVRFTSTSGARTIDTNNAGFFNLSVIGGASFTASDSALLIAGDYGQTAGSLLLPSATTTVGGSFNVTGGTFNANNGLLRFTATDAGNVVRFGGSNTNAVTFAGTGGIWAMMDTHATATDTFRVVSGAVTLPSGTLAVGSDFVVTGAITHNNGTIRLYGTDTDQVFGLGSSDAYSVEVVAGAGSYRAANLNLSLLGDFTITSGAFTSASGTLAIGGSFAAAGGDFIHNNGTVLFNSADTGETVLTAGSSFYNVVFGSPAGGWTMLDSATSTRNFSLTSAANFTATPGTRLAVQGVFTNTVGGAATTWTGSTLALLSGSIFETNTKLTPAEVYDTIQVGAHTDISSWNSSAGTTTVMGTGSWYSKDHAAVDGSLYIYGDYHIATTTQYWSHGRDFDGTLLGAGSRAVTVAIASSSTVTLDGGTLRMIGATGATTTVTHQGVGTYTFAATAGSFTADNYAFRNLGPNGLQLSGTVAVLGLNNGDFVQAANSTTLLNLTNTVINNNASLQIHNTRFATGGFAAGTNVRLNATTTNSWRFIGALGNLWGEEYDVDGVDACSSIRWDNSACLLTEQTYYRWRHDDGGEGAVNAQWMNTDWSKRKRVRVVNEDAVAYTDVPVKLQITYDADMQTDFDDLRFTAADGVTPIDFWIQKRQIGSSAIVWIKTPALAPDAVSEFYMYYGNTGAATISSVSNTFDAFDTFEDNNISEYSGNTSLFSTTATYAFGGSYGLGTIGFQSSKATDGIARTDMTVAQGHEFRFMQYVDTGSGSGDEVCTMFGVQAPVTANQNYGVCIEQFGIDRVSLVRNVENTDSTGVLLASSTIALSTGWYEVVVDWQTGGHIRVDVFNNAGVHMASTTAVDNTYNSGGFGFTYWFQHGGWDSVLIGPRTNTTPVAFIGAEQVRNGATWAAAQNTPGSGFLIGHVARLRLAVENSGLPIADKNFRLEFAPKLTAPNCEAVSSGSYTAVPIAASCGSSAICMANGSTITNGAATTDHLVTAGGNFVPGQIIEQTANQTGDIDIAQQQYTELEYAISLTANAVNDAYCFRVTDAGAELDSYAKIPELTLAFDPVINPVILNDGLDIVLTPGATTTIVASTTVTDYNGFADLAAATTTFYRSSATAACAPDDNDCYIASGAQCTFSNCVGSSCTLTCSADFQYHADPTDLDGGEFWYAFMEVADQAGGVAFGTSVGVDILTLRALDVQNEIAYGNVDINNDTGTYNPTVMVLNSGNESIDVRVAGTDMTDGAASVIPAGQQRFSTSAFNYMACVGCTTLSVTGADIEVDLFKPIAAAPPVSDEIYWGIAVPFGTASNPHEGINTFTAIGD